MGGKDNNVYPGGAAINGGKQKPARIRGLRRIKKPTARGLHVDGFVSQVARGRRETGPAVAQLHKAREVRHSEDEMI